MKKRPDFLFFNTKRISVIVSCLIILVFVVWQGVSYPMAEDVGSTTPGGATSRLKIISDILSDSGYRTVGPGIWGDWGAMWNRICWASIWGPNATATVDDVVSGKTFYTGGNRVRQTGQGVTQNAPSPVSVSADPSKISIIFQATKTRSYGSESGGGWGNWGFMWNRIYSASVWTPSDANAIPENVALGETFYAGNNRILQTGTYVYQPPSGPDITDPIVNAGADQHSYVNIVRLFIGTATDPESGIASFLWTKQSGLGAVTFGNSTANITTVKANTAGTYTLRLTVTNTIGLSSSDDTLYVVHKMADYNNDGRVDELDFAYLAINWNGTNIMADFNADGIVDELDFALLAINWTG